MEIDLNKLKQTLAEYKSRPWYANIVMNVSFLWVLIRSDGFIRGCRTFFLTIRDQNRYAKAAKVRLNKFAKEHGYVRVNGKLVKNG